MGKSLKSALLKAILNTEKDGSVLVWKKKSFVKILGWFNVDSSDENLKLMGLDEYRSVAGSSMTLLATSKEVFEHSIPDLAMIKKKKSKNG